MKSINNVLIYPYNHIVYPLAITLVRKGINIIPVAYNESNLIGNDISFAVNRKATNILVSKFSEEILELVDAIYLTKHRNNSFNDDYIFNKLLLCNIPKLDLSHYSMENYDTIQINTASQMNYINVPVIIVGGLFDNYDLTYITMALKRKMENGGFKVTSISNDKNDVFSHRYPDEFIEPMNAVEYRIAYLNHYINNLSKKTNADLLIVQLPGGMTRINDGYFNSFGSWAYMISESITSEYFVFSLNRKFINRQFVENLSTHFERKFDFKMDSLHISNVKYDLEKLSNFTSNQKLIYLCEDSAMTFSRENYGILAGDFYHDDYLEAVYSDILSKLGGSDGDI